MGKPTGSQGIKGYVYRVPGGQGVGVGLHVLTGSRGKPKGSLVVKEWAY